MHQHLGLSVMNDPGLRWAAEVFSALLRKEISWAHVSLDAMH